VLPVIRPTWKLQPVHAADLGKAIALAALDPKSHAGQTYELGGPNVMTMAELNKWICDTTGRHRPLALLPDPVGKAIARLTGWLPMAPITWDQWLMMSRDNVATGPGFEAFGLHPAPLAAIAPAWLVPFRRHGRFAKA
jgi:NADH dehydrogenase